MSVSVNQTAPDFTLYNSERQQVTLSQFKDSKNVVLLFFPLAFTGVCTKELCSTRDDIGSYEGLNAEVLTISTDTPQTLAKWKEMERFNFQMLSDYNKEVAPLYASLYETFSLGMKGVCKRSAFVIDKNGVIQYAEILENAGEIPDLEAVKKVLSGL